MSTPRYTMYSPPPAPCHYTYCYRRGGGGVDRGEGGRAIHTVIQTDGVEAAEVRVELSTVSYRPLHGVLMVREVTDMMRGGQDGNRR